jgi:hypothetical protein
VANSKAWNPATGTFDLKRLDMTWAKPIHTRWKQREKIKQQVKAARVKQAIDQLDGYEIIKDELGHWYLMKNGKIVSPNKYPELYEQLEKCKEYLDKDQYKEKKIEVVKNEMPFAPGIGGVLGNLGKAGKIADTIKKGIGVVKVGQSIVDQINNAPTINVSEKETEWEKDNRVPKDNETILGEKDFKRTKKKVKGAVVYEKDGKFYHRDTLHKGKGSHLEVYDKLGNHLGEADSVTGEIIPGTRDKNKKLPK